MRYEDLPAGVRAQVDRKVGAPAKQRRGKGGGSTSGRASWRCANCGEVFTTWASVERHDPTHTRIDCVLEPAAKS